MLKRYSKWLVKESVNLEINKEYHNGHETKLFLRWVHSFLRHLDKKEKKVLLKYIPTIEANIESISDKIVLKDIKEALKETKKRKVSVR
jgi:uncharacterized protein (UPF0210 family)